MAVLHEPHTSSFRKSLERFDIEEVVYCPFLYDGGYKE